MNSRWRPGSRDASAQDAKRCCQGALRAASVSIHPPASRHAQQLHDLLIVDTGLLIVFPFALFHLPDPLDDAVLGRDPFAQRFEDSLHLCASLGLWSHCFPRSLPRGIWVGTSFVPRHEGGFGDLRVPGSQGGTWKTGNQVRNILRACPAEGEAARFATAGADEKALPSPAVLKGPEALWDGDRPGAGHRSVAPAG